MIRGVLWARIWIRRGNVYCTVGGMISRSWRCVEACNSECEDKIIQIYDVIRCGESFIPDLIQIPARSLVSSSTSWDKHIPVIVEISILCSLSRQSLHLELQELSPVRRSLVEDLMSDQKYHGFILRKELTSSAKCIVILNVIHGEADWFSPS